MDEHRDLAEDFDCPSLLCEELEDWDNIENQGRGRREGGEDEDTVSQREDEEGGQHTEREEEEEENGKKVISVSGKEVIELEGEEQAKPESGLKAEEAQEVQMEKNIGDDEKTISDKEEDKETNGLGEKNERKKSRKRRSKKKSERVRTKKGLKNISIRVEEEKKRLMQEVVERSSEEALVNSCDLSDSAYLSGGGVELSYPSVPIPPLYSTQPQPAPPPPQPHLQPAPPQPQPHLQPAPPHPQPHLQPAPAHPHPQPHHQPVPPQPHPQPQLQPQPHLQPAPPHPHPHLQPAPPHPQPQLQSAPPHPQLQPAPPHPQLQLQPAPPQPQGTKRPHSPLLPHTLHQPAPQPMEMEIMQVYSTRRSIRFTSRGRGRTLSFPLLSELEPADGCLLPPAPKKKTRTLYNTEQLEHLEGLFQDDHYPDAEKRKVIAASVGVTPQRIMVWFQNRRAKWRKVERSDTGKVEHKPSRTGSSSSPRHHHTNPTLLTVAPPTSKGSISVSSHFDPKAPLLLPAPHPVPTLPTQTLPSYSALLASLTSPSQSQTTDEGLHQPSSRGGLVEYHPTPMPSPPPLRRASLPLFATAYNPINPNPTPPLLSTPVHTPPLFLDALEGSSSLAYRDTQSLQTDTSSLFDYGEKLDYLTSSQQINTLSYQLQTSYPPSQPQPQASLPRLAYLTPSPYLTPNPPDSNPTSYLTFGPGGNSTGMVTYATGGHTYFQSQSAGQILLQSTGHHGGITAYQSYPWGNMYSQAAMFQHAQGPPSSSYSSSLGAAREHQPPSTTTLPPPPYFSLGGHGPSQRSSHSQTHTSTTTTVLPSVSTLRPSRLRQENPPSKVTSLPTSQVNPVSPESPPVPSGGKLEYDSPRELHSHFHCDFSPIHF